MSNTVYPMPGPIAGEGTFAGPVAFSNAVRAGRAVEIDDAKAALAGQGAVFDDYGNQIHAVALSRAIKGALAP